MRMVTVHVRVSATRFVLIVVTDPTVVGLGRGLDLLSTADADQQWCSPRSILMVHVEADLAFNSPNLPTPR